MSELTIFDSRFRGGPLDGALRRLTVQQHDLTVWAHIQARGIVEVERFAGERRHERLWTPHRYVLAEGGDGWSYYDYAPVRGKGCSDGPAFRSR